MLLQLNTYVSNRAETGDEEREGRCCSHELCNTEALVFSQRPMTFLPGLFNAAISPSPQKITIMSKAWLSRKH